jgi:hypothetical protein
MVRPRFRHAAVKLNDGGILLVGGQVKSTVTVINEQVAEGQTGRQTQVTVFTTTNESEVYSPTDAAFSLLTIPNTTRASKLNTPRGRAGHAVEKLAGPDNTLDSADDVLLVAGGFQTLSAQFAPRSKLPGAVGRVNADGLTVLEFFDPQTDIFTQVGNVQLASPRINDPYLMNLGVYNDYTIDGVKGMGNVMLVTHGNTDGTCPVTPLIDEVLVANYTGFGPAQGLQFFLVEDTQTFSHVQGIEYYAPPDLDLTVGRCASNPVALPRRMATVPGVQGIETWVFALGGVYIFISPAGCVYAYGDHPTISSGCVFDPFFSLPAVTLGLSTRDLTSSRSASNPTGVVGTWLSLDGGIPTTDLSMFQENVQGLAEANGMNRVFHRNIPVAGVDGILYTSDDRVLLAGGGVDYPGFGGEPTVPSAEIFLPPGATSNVPSP